MPDSGGAAHGEWHRCHCSPGCPEVTKRRFAPGHDQRLIGYLKGRMERGEITAGEARREAIDRGGTAGILLRLATTIRRGGFE